MEDPTRAGTPLLSRAGLMVGLLLLALTAAVSLLAAVLDPPRRASSPEAVVRSYFSALELGDADAALMQLAPSARGRWVDFVKNGLHNNYRVLGIAVRQTSIVDRLRGAATGPQDVTTFVEVTLAAGGEQWRAGPRVPLVGENGRWYLGRPPLAD